MWLNANFAALISFCFLCGCATSPEGRSQLSLVSQKRVERNATKAFQRIKKRNVLVKDETQIKYVLCVLQALTRDNTRLDAGARSGSGVKRDEHLSGFDGEWNIIIIRNDQPNATAFPGRNIVVHSGLLRVAVNQDQLAAALGHEIAHLIAGHGVEQTSAQVLLEGAGLLRGSSPASQTSAGPVKLGLFYTLSQIQEEEADLIGLDLMINAGFIADEALHLWNNMQIYSELEPHWTLFRTHPSQQDRVQKLEKRIAERKAQFVFSSPNTSKSESLIGQSSAERQRPRCETHL